MQVHGLDKLHEFCGRHPQVRSWINTWLATTRGSNWISPQDIKYRFARASILRNNLVIFDVKGNDYRMLTQVAYQSGIVVVKWIGTHDAYDKITWEHSRNEASGR